MLTPAQRIRIEDMVRRGIQEEKDGFLPCSDCLKRKPVNQFRVNTKMGKYQYRDGRCDPCRKRISVCHNMALTIEQYDDIMSAESCAICRRPFGPDLAASIDHCHETGMIRQTLCTPCNTGLGLLQDNPHIARAAAVYLERWKAVHLSFKQNPADLIRNERMGKIRQRGKQKAKGPAREHKL